MAKVIVSPVAVIDLESLKLRLEQQFGDTVALSKMRRIYGFLKRLESFPALGRRRDQVGQGFRSFAVSPNVVLYRFIAEDIVEIVRVVDGRLDLKALFRADETAEES